MSAIGRESGTDVMYDKMFTSVHNFFHPQKGKNLVCDEGELEGALVPIYLFTLLAVVFVTCRFYPTTTKEYVNRFPVVAF